MSIYSDGEYYQPKSLTYSDAMRRIVRQYSCSRKEAHAIMQEFIARRHFKLKEDND
jgi:hypothetical protein